MCIYLFTSVKTNTIHVHFHWHDWDVNSVVLSLPFSTGTSVPTIPSNVHGIEHAVVCDDWPYN